MDDSLLMDALNKFTPSFDIASKTKFAKGQSEGPRHNSSEVVGAKRPLHPPVAPPRSYTKMPVTEQVRRSTRGAAVGFSIDFV